MFVRTTNRRNLALDKKFPIESLVVLVVPTMAFAVVVALEKVMPRKHNVLHFHHDGV